MGENFQLPPQITKKATFAAKMGGFRNPPCVVFLGVRVPWVSTLPPPPRTHTSLGWHHDPTAHTVAAIPGAGGLEKEQSGQARAAPLKSASRPQGTRQGEGTRPGALASHPGAGGNDHNSCCRVREWRQRAGGRGQGGPCPASLRAVKAVRAKLKQFDPVTP